MASAETIDQRLAHFFSESGLPIVDTRTADDYALGHLAHATNIPAETLFERLHELPIRAVPLRVVVSPEREQSLLSQFNAKGFDVRALLVWTEKLTKQLAAQDKLIANNQSERLWQPAKIVAEFVDKFAPQKPGLSALDIGCGSGRDAVFLALHNWQVTAIDNQQSALDKAQQFALNANVNIATINLDVEESPQCLDTYSNTFDAVVVIRYLHRPLFNQIQSLIKPGGFIVYQTFMQGCEAFGRPKNPRFLLKPDELAQVFADFTVLVDKVEHLNDGRPTNVFIAQKKRSIGVS